MDAASLHSSPKIFISVDMEGIGGIGTSEMLGVGGKHYAMGRPPLTAPELRRRLREGVTEALGRLESFQPMAVREPVEMTDC